MFRLIPGLAHWVTDLLAARSSKTPRITTLSLTLAEGLSRREEGKSKEQGGD